ncbi:MAG: hypothetical protein KGL35_25785, partial [Bradyrhizobium sp.]|nr:hypothetical protein [Bradyrhizobium sp.]
MSVASGTDPIFAGSALGNGVTSALTSAPELLSTPGLALDAGGSLDPTTFAPVVSHVATVQSSAQALAQEKVDTQGNTQGNSGGGFFHELGHLVSSIPGAKSVEHAVGGVIHYLGAPLREIQRDYRMVHLAWTKNGPVAGLLTTLGVVAGAAAGGFLGGSEGAILGGEGAAFLERQGFEHLGGHGQGYTANGQTNYNEGLAATAALSADPHLKISWGRDYANALGQVPGLHTLRNTDKGFGKLVSGAQDAAGDWELDPVVALSKFQTGLKLGEYGTGAKAAAEARVASSTAEAATGGAWLKVRNAAQRFYS